MSSSEAVSLGFGFCFFSYDDKGGVSRDGESSEGNASDDDRGKHSNFRRSC